MDTNTDMNLARLFERGGVYHRIPGDTPADILAVLIGSLPDFPGLEATALLQTVLERETLMSTGIGKGIALPHPRTPLLKENDEPFAAIAFPAQPVDWSTPDGSLVHTIFLIVSSSAKQHLNTLSKINFLCQQEKFYSLIKDQAPKEKIIAAIRELEEAWEKAGKDHTG